MRVRYLNFVICLININRRTREEHMRKKRKKDSNNVEYSNDEILEDPRHPNLISSRLESFSKRRTYLRKMPLWAHYGLGGGTL